MVLLISESVSVLLLSLLAIGLMPFYGITANFNEAVSGFGNQVTFFVMMSFVFGKIISSVPLCRRMLIFLLHRLGNRIERIILAIMICTAFTSAFVADIPACVIYLAFAEEVLHLYTNEADRKRTARALMLGVSFSAMLGGMITPVGSTVNVLASSIFETQTGVAIPFVKWISLGIPVAVVLVPVLWFFLVKIFKPVSFEHNQIDIYIESQKPPKRLFASEKKVLTVLAIMLSLWVASSWVKEINVMHTLFCGVALLCIPKIGVINIKEAFKNVNWDVIFLLSVVMVLSSVLMKNGFGNFLADIFPAQNISFPLFITLMALTITVLLIFIPVMPVMAMLTVPVFLALGNLAGINPQITVVSCGICVACCYALPFDAVYQLTYCKKHYAIKDMTRISLLLIPVTVILLIIIGYGIQYLWDIFKL